MIVATLLFVASLFSLLVPFHRSWATSEPMPPPLKKILVIGVLQNYLIRQEIEDEMEKLPAKTGVEGARSDMVLPPRNELKAN